MSHWDYESDHQQDTSGGGKTTATYLESIIGDRVPGVRQEVSLQASRELLVTCVTASVYI